MERLLQNRCSRTPVVAIVGAGFAGTLTAANLLTVSSDPLQILLIERSGRFGPGVAYSTDDCQHLLNVPAEAMSAICEQPDHFRDWARRELGESRTAAYLARGSFGAYLRAVLADAERRAPPSRLVRRVPGEAIGFGRAGDQLELTLADGRRLRCDRIVLALGSPGPNRVDSLPEDPRIITDPWSADERWRSTQEPGDDGLSLVIGTGLTAVDTILSLGAGTRSGQVMAISRTGKLPHAHRPGVPRRAPAPLLPAGPVDLATVEQIVRGHICAMRMRGYGWREAIDGMRPITPQLWGLLSWDERERFLRERSRDWEICRHRMAPAVHRRLRILRSQRRLSVVAASVLGARTSRRLLRVRVALAPENTEVEVDCRRVIVCAGASTDLSNSENRLLQSMLRSGTISMDPLRLGLRTGTGGAVLDAAGRCEGRIFTLGPLRRGELWETTAVGEIRVQASELAGEIAGSLYRPAVAAA